MKTKVKEAEVPEIQKKLDTVMAPLKAIKDTFEPIIKKLKEQEMAKAHPPHPPSLKSKSPNKVPPPKQNVMPIIQNSIGQDKIKQLQVRRGSIDKSKSPIRGTTPKESPKEKREEKSKSPSQEEGWKSDNIMENQLKQRYFTRKEKSMNLIDEYKNKIFDLKRTKFEMICNALPPFLPPSHKNFPNNVKHDVVKAFKKQFTSYLSMKDLIEMNTQTTFFNQAFIGEEVG